MCIRDSILPFLLDGLMEGEALYSLPISWGTVSLGCSKELLDGRTTLTAEEALELLEAMDEGALLFPSWISCGGAPNELAAYLPRYGEEADGYAGESTLLDRVIIYSSAQLAAMLTEPDALSRPGAGGGMHFALDTQELRGRGGRLGVPELRLRAGGPPGDERLRRIRAAREP